MKFSTWLIHRCTIVHQNQKVGEDDYGQDIYENTIVENVPCRFDQLKTSRSPGETGTDYITSYVLFLDAETNISLDMKFQNIKDKEGNTVIPGEFIATEVFPMYGKRKLHHFEVNLKQG